MTDGQDVGDRTQADENSGAAFSALRPRARTLFVAYTSLSAPSIKEAAEKVEFSYANAREIFASDPFQAALLEWHTALHQETRNALKVAALEAARALIGRLTSGDEDVIIRAATAILDRAGHAPKQEIDMRADVKTTRTDTAPTEDLEAQLLRLATARPAADAG
jgi:hypothetical protein